jgi:hypothetical protein
MFDSVHILKQWLCKSCSEQEKKGKNSLLPTKFSKTVLVPNGKEADASRF